jgi:aminopeptidase-like protein
MEYMIQENFVIDSKGRKVAVQIPLRIYEKLVSDAEELDEIREYRKAKSYKGNAIPFKDAFEEIETWVGK